MALLEMDILIIVYLPLLLDNQTAAGNAQNSAVGNAANQYTIGRYIDITNTTALVKIFMVTLIGLMTG